MTGIDRLFSRFLPPTQTPVGQPSGPTPTNAVVPPAPVSTPELLRPARADFSRISSDMGAPPPLDIEAARLAENVYAPGGAPPGWTRVPHEELAERGVDPGLLRAHGMQAELYRDASGRHVLAYAGNNGGDELAVVNQSAGGHEPQYQAAIELARQVNGAYPGVSFTGHSMGGGLASAGALATGRHATTFNAQGLGDGTLRMLNMSRPQAEGAPNVHAISLRGDWATDLQNGTPLPDAVGRKDVLDQPPGQGLDPLAAHNMGPLIAALERRGGR